MPPRVPAPLNVSSFSERGTMKLDASRHSRPSRACAGGLLPRQLLAVRGRGHRRWRGAHRCCLDRAKGARKRPGRDTSYGGRTCRRSRVLARRRADLGGPCAQALVTGNLPPPRESAAETAQRLRWHWENLPAPTLCEKCDPESAAYVPSTSSIEHYCSACDKWTCLCADHGPHLDPGTVAFAVYATTIHGCPLQPRRS